jgi:hypothetical protein
LPVVTTPDPLGVSVIFWSVPPAVIPAAPAKVKAVRLMAVGSTKLFSVVETPPPPLGVAQAGIPPVEIWLMNWPLVQVRDLTPPNVLAVGVGRSAPTNARKVGVAALPELGPAIMRLAF